MPVLVIGNGESRRSLDISPHIEKFTSVGCNAIYRDYVVDHLICCDQKIAAESMKNSSNAKTKIYTRSKWLETNLSSLGNFYPLPDLPFKQIHRADEEMNWGSGPYAVLLGSMISDTVILIGFDLHSTDSFVNNVYKGTENYSKPDSLAVDPSYWIYQISKIFEFYQDKSFVVLNNKDWQAPAEWRKDNVRIKEYNFLHEFVDI